MMNIPIVKTVAIITIVVIVVFVVCLPVAAHLDFDFEGPRSRETERSSP